MRPRRTPANSVRSILAWAFKALFNLKFARHSFFGFYKRLVVSQNIFRGVQKRFVLDNGITLSLKISQWIPANLYFLGEYEPAEINFITSALLPGDVFVDIGANIGLYTLSAAKAVGPSGLVIAFEPFEENYRTLVQHLQLNDISNVQVERCAVGDRKSIKDIFYDEKEVDTGTVSMYLKEYSVKESVQTIALDEYTGFAPNRKISLIKIDIEGGEYKALLGMKNILQMQKPKLLIEINPALLELAGTSPVAIFEFLSSLGYSQQQSTFGRDSLNIVFAYQAGKYSRNFVTGNDSV